MTTCHSTEYVSCCCCRGEPMDGKHSDQSLVAAKSSACESWTLNLSVHVTTVPQLLPSKAGARASCCSCTHGRRMDVAHETDAHLETTAWPSTPAP